MTSDKQKAARIRNWNILRLRGVQALLREHALFKLDGAISAIQQIDYMLQDMKADSEYEHINKVINKYYAD